MGKIVQVKTGYADVMLPPYGLPFNAGQTTTLTDAEYAALTTATTRALTITQSGVIDPVRSTTNSPTSLADALAQAVSFAQTQQPLVLLPLPSGGDDAPAVNAVIAASPTNSIILARPGYTYVAISSPFLFLGTRSYHMYGVTMRAGNGANLDAVVASPAALTTGAGNNLDGPIQIHGLTVNGNVANQTAGQGNGILLSSGANVLYGPTFLKDVHVRDTRGTGICVSEVNLDGTPLGNGTAAPYSGEMHFENCRTYNSGANGIWQRGGAVSGINMTDGFCVNCTVAYTTHDGIRIDSSGGWRIDGNHPYGTGLSGIITTGSFSTRITGNYIEGIGVLDTASDHFSSSSAFSQAPTWSGATTYSFNQVVFYSGVIYKSKVDSNLNNQPDVSTTQWAAYNGGSSVGAIMGMSSQSARPITITGNQISLGHNSWGLNSNFQYRGILVQGPATGTSKASAIVIGNDVANELQPAGTNTTTFRYASQGAGPSGVNPYERDNSIRGNWNSTRSADSTCAPVIAAGAGAGASPTLVVTGNNQAGNLSVTTGASGVAAGALVSISYTTSLAPAPRVLVTPRDAAATASLGIYVTTSASGFTINATNAPAISTQYKFDYVAMIGA